MRTNYGLHPADDQVAAAKKWIEDSLVFDPWLPALGGGRQHGRQRERLPPNFNPQHTSKTKVARLAGKEPGSGKVHVLIKLHDGAGRAIYLDNLVTGQMRRISHPSDEVWNQYSYRKLGIEILHPSDIRATDGTGWVAHGKKEAERRGLKVEE
jgi:hypothetical protein